MCGKDDKDGRETEDEREEDEWDNRDGLANEGDDDYLTSH